VGVRHLDGDALPCSNPPRRGYWNNRFEIEAREFADSPIATRLRAMLLGAPRVTESGRPRFARLSPPGDGGFARALAHSSQPKSRLAVLKPAGNEHERPADGKRDRPLTRPGIQRKLARPLDRARDQKMLAQRRHGHETCRGPQPQHTGEYQRQRRYE